MVYFKQIKRYDVAVMNEDNNISFAYICGNQHGRATITIEQYNHIKSILYGEETKEA